MSTKPPITLTVRRGNTTIFTAATTDFNGDYWACLDAIEREVQRLKGLTVDCGDYRGLDAS